MQSGSLWGQGFRVWIDWNGNNSFADPGESVYASPGSGTGVYTTTITVPLTALAGTRRMRVQCQYFTVPLATDYIKKVIDKDRVGVKRKTARC